MTSPGNARLSHADANGPIAAAAVFEQVGPAEGRRGCSRTRRAPGQRNRLGLRPHPRRTEEARHHPRPFDRGRDPGPKRGEGTWSEFIKRHTDTLWACDFFSKKVWTQSGLVEVFVLFFIHVGTRRVHVAGMTANPDEAWIVQQARNTCMAFAEELAAPTHLIMDMDAKFTTRFRDTFASEGIEVVRVGPRKPNLNAFAERFVQSVRTESLDHFVCFGIEHLRHIVSRYCAFYNRHRPHQGRQNRTLPDAAGEEQNSVTEGEVLCQEDLGGLLRHYYRKAA